VGEGKEWYMRAHLEQEGVLGDALEGLDEERLEVEVLAFGHALNVLLGEEFIQCRVIVVAVVVLCGGGGGPPKGCRKDCIQGTLTSMRDLSLELCWVSCSTLVMATL
jgi:hypothetical protein